MFFDDSADRYCHQQYSRSPCHMTSFSAGHVTDDVTMDAPCHVTYVYGEGSEWVPAASCGCGSAVYSSVAADCDVYSPHLQALRHCEWRHEWRRVVSLMR